MATSEHTINDALAGVLRATKHAWEIGNIVSYENTGMLKGNAKRPDILVTEENVSPVVIENEVLPATTVASEAISRLGAQLRANGRTILSSIALRTPERLRQRSGASLHAEISTASDVEMVLYTGTSPSAASRWPGSGWLRGSVADLSILAQSASVPPAVIDAAVFQLVSGVSEAAGLILEMAKAHAGGNTPDKRDSASGGR
jgi:hypothetical protein